MELGKRPLAKGGPAVKCARYVAEFLAREGAAHVFEMAGGAIAHLLDAVHEHPALTAVSMHHEQAAAFAAEGYARSLAGEAEPKRLGAAMATSGPGALNLLTGIGSCYFDSVPCLFLTGQVNTYEYKFDEPVRQNGFQETDIVRVAAPLVKHAELVADASRIRYALEKAAYVARSGRPGPVLLDLPMDVQRAEIEPDSLESYYESEEYRAAEAEAARLEAGLEEAVGRTLERLRRSSRPLVLAGGGVRSAGAVPALREWLERAGLPAAASLMGLDALPSDAPPSEAPSSAAPPSAAPSSAALPSDAQPSGGSPAGGPPILGLIGTYGHRYANLAVANCDLLLALGTRLDTRQTGTNPRLFAREAELVHVDIDAVELGRKIAPAVAAHGDVGSFLRRLLARWPAEGADAAAWEPWKAALRKYRESLPTGGPGFAASGPIDPNRFMERLGGCAGEDDIVCLDVGQHQMWASQSFPLGGKRRMLNAGGMGAMGFGLPAAIGAALANPGRRVIVIAGDGGIQVNVQELETLARLRLPIRVVVLNNRSLGMVRQFQDTNFQGRLGSTVHGYGCPDLIAVARAYGLPAWRIGCWEEADPALGALFAEEGPSFAEVAIDPRADVRPKLGVGKPPEDMDPPLDRQLLRSLMIAKPADDLVF